jgi:proline iminopeptidase
MSDGYLTGADSAQLFYQVVGKGSDTVVVVHGGPGAGSNDIRPDLEPLTRSQVVIFYDQRGGGRSALPADTTLLTGQHFVDDLEAVRTHFRLAQMKLLAHSFGAIIVARYAEVFPNRIARMVFLGATGPSREEAARFYQTAPPGGDTAVARLLFVTLEALTEGTAPDPVAACREYEQLSRRQAAAQGEFAGWKGSACAMPAASVAYYFRYTARIGPEAFGDWDFTQSLRQLRAPLLVIDGALDTRGVSMERAWAQAVAQGRLLLVPNAGRAAHAERPDVVFPAIQAFLAGTWPAGALAVH